MAISVENRKKKFPTPLVFCIPAEGVPLEMGTDARRQKTRMMGLPGRQRSLTTSSAVWIQCTKVTDGWTDRDGRHRRPCLRIASCGKNEIK